MVEEYRKKILKITCITVICFVVFIGFLKGNKYFLANKENIISVVVKNKSYSPNDLMASVVELNPTTTRITQKIKPAGPVFNGLTVGEVAKKLNKRFGGVLKEKGYQYASSAMNKGMDPFIPAAISILETGNGTSYLATKNNVGGIKCSSTRYCSYITIEEGIEKYINMIYKGYYLKGLTTIELMAPKYAESDQWAFKVGRIYMELIAE